MLKSKMMSLYDYLGHAAGNQLGKQVAEVATSMGIKIQTRYVCNPSYTGNVCLYPESFLSLYFKKSLERKVSEPQDNTLPF
jgi:hypothetical protein